MSYHIFLAIYSFGLLVNVVKSDDLALSNRLYQQLCSSYENSQLGRVLPGSSGSSSVCPVIEKEGARNEWTFNTCGGSSKGDDGTQIPSEPDDTGYDYEDKIMNGRDAIPFSHPYIVYLRTDVLEKGLSGTVYNRYTILVNTHHLERHIKAAESKDHILIHIGKYKHSDRENEEQIRFMCNHTTHPKYRRDKSYFVYSAIHLYDPITINNYADKIPLAKPSQANSIEKTCLLPGWGSKGGRPLTENIMQDADAIIRPCVDNPAIDDNEFCTNPVYCWADSGSPLVCTDKHRVFANALASATGQKTSTSCKKSKDSIFADLKIQELQDWVEQSYREQEQFCRPLLRAEVF